MEPPQTKKSKLEDDAEKSKLEDETDKSNETKLEEDTANSNTRQTSTEDAPAQHTPVRQQLHDLLVEASAKSCGTPLPGEMTEKIIDYCLFSDFSELPDYALEEGEILSKIAPPDSQEDPLADPLRRNQLMAIMDLPGKPLEAWGEDIEEVADNGDISFWWTHVGFPVGWKGSGEMLEFDLWMCAEYHHWHGVFVFEKGSTAVLLRYEPIEFCKPVKYPHRAKELSKESAGFLWAATDY
jgi:hypothetical protein